MPVPEGAELAEELRRLKDRAGLSLSQLTTRTWYSKSSLERYINGKVFPPRRVVEAISDSCGGDTDAMVAAWERAWSALRGRSDHPAAPAATLDPRPVPMELPADLPDFTGRLACCAGLEAHLTADDSPAPPVAVISGMAGTGKTALAVHVAHRLAADFPDGLLYLHLAGMSARPVRPRDALGQLLRSLGVGGAAIPDSTEERAALYRSRVANRRILLLADDAASATQVRPLIPGTSGSALIVTTRIRMVELDGARLHQLEPFRRDEALELLRILVGTNRIDANPAVAERVVSSCGSLPLAIRIIGSRLAGGLRPSLDDLAIRLVDERVRLDELAVGDVAVRSSLELSFRALTPVQRVALTRLATLDGADARVWMVAALADLGMVEAEALVDDLIAANLLTDTGRDTTGQRALVMHDLVRDYARERSHQDDSDDSAGRDAAVARFLGAWLTVAERAESMLGQRYFPPPRSPQLRWRPKGLRDAMFEAPKSWYAGNRGGLISAVRLACESGHTETASIMAALFTSFFAAYSDWGAWRRTHDAVLAASGGLDPYALRGLGELELCLNRHPEALARLTEARSRLEAHGDHESVAYVLVLLGVTRRKMGNLRSAARYFSLAARYFDELGNDRGRAHINLERGVQRMYQFQFPAAISHLQEARDGLMAAGDMRAVAWASYRLGAAYRMRERVPDARQWLNAAEEGFARLSDRASVALCLREVAELLRLEGKLDESAALLVRALATFRELAEPSGEMLALHGLGNVIGETNPDRGVAGLARAAHMARQQSRPATEKRITDDIDNLRRKSSQPVP